MSSKKSTNQHLALNAQRHAAISEIFKRKAGFTCQGIIGSFIDDYLLCEVLAKKLQSYYRTETGKRGKDELRIDVLKAAIKHFDLRYEEEQLKLVFQGGGGKSGQKSARQLRNGYIHELNQSDKAEIEARHTELMAAIYTFLENTRSVFDHVSG